MPVRAIVSHSETPKHATATNIPISVALTVSMPENAIPRLLMSTSVIASVIAKNATVDIAISQSMPVHCIAMHMTHWAIPPTTFATAKSDAQPDADDAFWRNMPTA